MNRLDRNKFFNLIHDIILLATRIGQLDEYIGYWQYPSGFWDYFWYNILLIQWSASEKTSESYCSKKKMDFDINLISGDNRTTDTTFFKQSQCSNLNYNPTMAQNQWHKITAIKVSLIEQNHCYNLQLSIVTADLDWNRTFLTSKLIILCAPGSMVCWVI